MQFFTLAKVNAECCRGCEEFLFFNQRSHVSVMSHSLGGELYGVFDFCVCGGPYQSFFFWSKVAFLVFPL